MNKLIFVNRYFSPDHSATSQLLTDLATHLATHLCSKKFQIHVVTSGQIYDDPSARLPNVEMVGGVHVKRVWTSRFGRRHLASRTIDYVTFYVSAAWFLAKLIKFGDIIIVKTDPPLISVVAAAVVRFRGGRLINWIQDLFPEIARALGVPGNKWTDRFLCRLRNFSLHSARYNVVLGNRMAQRLIGNGIRPDTIKVIHNWADSNEISPIDRNVNPLRKSWGLENKFVVGYSGNMGRVHEFETILKAAQILDKVDDIQFIFIGSGAQRAWLGAEVQRRKLKNIFFKPYQPRDGLNLSLNVPDIHLISLLPAMEGLIVPSKFYGIAAVGRPTIYVGDHNGEIPSILKAATCGYIVSIGDSSGLADRVLELSQDLERAKNMGEQARAIFNQQYEKRHAFAAWELLLSQAGNG